MPRYEPIEGTIVAVRQLSVLVEMGTLLEPKQVWIPRSVLEDDSTPVVGENDLSVAAWWIEKNL